MYEFVTHERPSEQLGFRYEIRDPKKQHIWIQKVDLKQLENGLIQDFEQRPRAGSTERLAT